MKVLVQRAPRMIVYFFLNPLGANKHSLYSWMNLKSVVTERTAFTVLN